MVQTGFTRKKVESLTLGEKLRKLRSDFRMTLPEVSKATRIQVKYLEYLENGAYEKLPADVYVRGFLRSYARYLNVDEQALLRLYEREQNIQENLGREGAKTKAVSQFSPSSLVITSRSVIVGLIVLVVFGAFFYLYQEFKTFAADPQLVILEPHSGAVVEGEEVLVRGKTDKGAQVSINDQAVFVDNEGLFSDKLFLQPGINTVRVRTLNRFDKEKAVTFSVDARYAPALPQPVVVEEPFRVEVTALVVPVMLKVTIDGDAPLTEELAPGATKQFEAKEQIVFDSNHGEATRIRMNDQELLLSEQKGPVQGVVFLKSGRKQ